MVDAITNLSPRFRLPYFMGGLTLTVLSEDHEGSKIIFDKGIKVFPKDWNMLYQTAYLYLFELDDLETAADLLNRAGDFGAPVWVKSLASRLYTRSGQLHLGIISLKQYLKHVTDPEGKKTIEGRIKDLEEELMKSKGP